jgi:hypothetical protein
MQYKYDSVVLFRAEFTNALNSADFHKFTLNQPALAKYVIEHAYSVIQQYGYIWPNIVAFAKNYAGVIDHYTHDNLDIQAKWAMHARLVRSFSIGA